MLLTKIHRDRAMLCQRIQARRREIRLQGEVVQLRLGRAFGAVGSVTSGIGQVQSAVGPILTIYRFVRYRRERREGSRWRRLLSYAGLGRALLSLYWSFRNRPQASV